MSGLRIGVFSVVISGISLAGCASTHQDFGEPMKLGFARAIPVSGVLGDKAAYDDEYVRVSGVITDVCARKGCWLRMGDGVSSETVFVKFTCPIEGRLIPMEAVGHEVVVEGEVTIEEISEADRKHYAEDAGQSPEEIAKIVGPVEVVNMASISARVMGMSGEG